MSDCDDATERAEVHWFTNEWEKTAFLTLRRGHTKVIDTYLDHDCIREGDGDALTDAAYAAWSTDRSQGLASVLIAEIRDDVTVLNRHALAELIRDGILTPAREVELTDGTTAEVGDTVIIRRNDRRLRDSKDWVRNVDTWTITGVRDDGSVIVGPTGCRFGGTVGLPVGYVVDMLIWVTRSRRIGRKGSRSMPRMCWWSRPRQGRTSTSR